MRDEGGGDLTSHFSSFPFGSQEASKVSGVGLTNHSGEASMEYRRLGNSGLKVSAVGLGGNNFGARVDEKETERIIHQALDVGINFIDTADIYSNGLSEDFIGKALRGKRRCAILASKFGRVAGVGPNAGGASRLHIMEQVESSLRRLGTDCIDLYQLHIHDPDTPIEETLRTLDDLIHHGKVRYLGCSQLTAWQTCEAVWTSRMLHLNAFVSVQPHYNLLRRDVEKELVPFCKTYGLGIIPYFPLESGFLTGKYKCGQPIPEGTRLATRPGAQRTLTEKNFAILARLEQFALDRARGVNELALAWLLADPAVSTVIAGATKPEQVVSNAKAWDWRLSPEDLNEIDRITQSETGVS